MYNGYLLLLTQQGSNIPLATDYSQFFTISPAGCGTLSGCSLTTSGGGSVSGFTVGTDGSITVDNTDTFTTPGNLSVKMNCAMNG